MNEHSSNEPPQKWSYVIEICALMSRESVFNAFLGDLAVVHEVDSKPPMVFPAYRFLMLVTVLVS